jgi:hypothetical protein
MLVSWYFVSTNFGEPKRLLGLKIFLFCNLVGLSDKYRDHPGEIVVATYV